MADSTALISIDEIVSRFLLKYKKSTDDAVIYTEHACMCIQDFSLYDSNVVNTVKVTIDATLKSISFPDDMQLFVDLVTPIAGGWWSFTEKSQIVNTTTTVAGVETRDSAQGEGATITHDVVSGYGAKAGWNKFRYTVDYQARRIYVDDVYDPTDYIVLIYVSSGIKATGTTTIPAFVMPMIDMYLLDKETYWISGLARERELRHREYWAEKRKVRDLINSMSYSQWRDAILLNATQTIQR